LIKSKKSIPKDQTFFLSIPEGKKEGIKKITDGNAFSNCKTLGEQLYPFMRIGQLVNKKMR